jgi:hypothetical protein
LGEKQKKKREDESKKIEERFSSALSKTACTQRRVAAGEIQEAQKESFKTDIFKFFLVFLFCFYSGTAKDCNAMWEERKKEASERAGAPERERERERGTEGNSSSNSCCSSRALQSLAMAAARFRGRSEGPRGVCHTARVSVVHVRRSDQRAHTHLGGSIYYLEAGGVEVPCSGAENLGTSSVRLITYDDT